MKKKKKKIIWLIIIVVVIAAVAFKMVSDANTKPILVSAEVGNQDVSEFVAISGTVQSSDYKLYFPAEGKVAKVNVKLGDQVKKGDLLATLDQVDYADTIKKAQLSLENEKLNLANAENKYFDLKEDIAKLEEDIVFYMGKEDQYEDDDNIPMLESYISRRESAEREKESLEKSIPSDETLKLQRNSVELAQMNYDILMRDSVEYANGLYAEFDGVITELNIEEGGSVSKGSPSIRLDSSKNLEVLVSIGKYDINTIKEGLTANITIADAVYTGKVTNVTSSAMKVTSGTNTTQAIQASIAFDDTENAQGVRLGVDADVDIMVASKTGVMSVPIEAVRADREGSYCYILNPAESENEKEPLFTPVKTYIQTGASSDAFIEVLGGLSLGQKIVANPTAQIDMIPICKIV